MATDSHNISFDARHRSVKTIARHIEDCLELQRKLRQHSSFNEFKYRPIFQLSDYWHRIVSGTYVTLLYLLVKLLYMTNVTGQFYMLSSFLAPKYRFWGAEILIDLANGREWHESGHFPRVTMCHFEVRVLGNLHGYTIQCVLMINMFNEKVFLFLWQSIRHGTFFEHFQSPLHDIVKVCNLWADNCPLQFIEKTIRTISHQTAVDWSNICREIIYQAIFIKSLPIGGEGHTVEIDESKFGKRKYHKGHHVEGQWIFGGIDCDSGDVFMVPVERRDAATLIPIIKRSILPGSTVISDFWKAYDVLGKEGYHHLKVNHKLNFVDPISGAHTNSIESTWRHAKAFLPTYRRHKAFFAGCLAKLIFLKKCKYQGRDPTVAFFQATGSLHPSTPAPATTEQDHKDDDEDDLLDDDDAYIPPGIDC